jgi:hypothetical protein
MIDLQRFADEYRYRTRIDEDGTKIIPGKVGHLFEYDEESFGVMIMPNPPRRQFWGFAKAKLIAGGFKVVQDGDGEGVATFDPTDPKQVKLAVRVAGVKRRRVLSAEHRERCVASLRPRLGGHPAPQDGRTRENDPVACCDDPRDATGRDFHADKRQAGRLSQ